MNVQCWGLGSNKFPPLRHNRTRFCPPDTSPNRTAMPQLVEICCAGFFLQKKTIQIGKAQCYDGIDSKAPVKSNVRCCAKVIVVAVVVVEASRAEGEVGGQCQSQRQAQMIGGGRGQQALMVER